MFLINGFMLAGSYHIQIARQGHIHVRVMTSSKFYCFGEILSQSTTQPCLEVSRPEVNAAGKVHIVTSHPYMDLNSPA